MDVETRNTRHAKGNDEMTSQLESLANQIQSLQERRIELLDQLYAIAGEQANLDRETALYSLEQKLTRLLVFHASLLGDD